MREKISMIVFVLILGCVLTSALVAVDYYTKDRIQSNRQFKLNTRVLDTLDIPYTKGGKDDVEKKFSENVTIEMRGEKELLFSIDSTSPQSDLDSATIPAGLRQEFENNENSLSQYTTISIENPGSEWQITDVGEAYIVERDGDKLNIYIRKKKFYVSQQDGNIAFQIAGSGLWGPIEGILALSPDLETIKGIAIIHQEETPGLGGRIVERDFLDKFAGKKIVPEIRLTKPDKASAENEVDGITGATATCEKFETIINSQAKEYTSLYTKGNP